MVAHFALRFFHGKKGLIFVGSEKDLRRRLGNGLSKIGVWVNS
jgi:hypothetical protein